MIDLWCEIGGLQRDAELGPAPQPEARAVARVAGRLLHPFQNAKDPVEAELVAQLQGAGRIAEPEADGVVDVVRRRDALLGDFRSDVEITWSAVRASAGHRQERP